MAFEKLKEYAKYKDARSTKMIKDVTLKINIYTLIEPRHQYMS